MSQVDNSLTSSKNVSAKNNSEKLLTFKLGNDEYAVDIMIVKEIRGWSSTTRLPNSSEAMCGVINLRGNIVPIFDLRIRFSQPKVENTSKNVFIILSVGTKTIGVVVDAVSDILDVSLEEIKQSPTSSEVGIDDKYIVGLISLEQRMVIVLDMDKLFGEELDNIDESELEAE